MQGLIGSPKLERLLYCSSNTIWCCANFVTQWKDIELNNCRFLIQTYIGEGDLPLNAREEMDPITSFTLDTCHSVAKQLKFDDGLNLKWIVYDKNFIPGSIDTTFRHWVDIGITTMCTISKEGNI